MLKKKYVEDINNLLKNDKGEYLFRNAVSWQEINRDDETFLEFLREVMSLLSQNKIPNPGPYCSYCKYIKNSKKLN